MASRIDAHTRADETIVPNPNRSLVQHSEIEVGEESLADADLLSVIAVERLIDNDPVIAYMAQQGFQNSEPRTCIRRPQSIVLVDDIVYFDQLPEQLLIGSRINLSGEHLFFLGHNY